MILHVNKPELVEFISNEVRAGHYPSPDALIEAAVERLMLEHGALDDETINAINRADEQYQRGEFFEWRAVRDELRKKITGS